MIHGDVILKGQDTEHQSLIPVMARLPNTDSDLTLDDWLAEVRQSYSKGMKVTLQSNDAVEITLQKLKDSRRGVNAYILHKKYCRFVFRCSDLISA